MCRFFLFEKTESGDKTHVYRKYRTSNFQVSKKSMWMQEWSNHLLEHWIRFLLLAPTCNITQRKVFLDTAIPLRTMVYLRLTRSPSIGGARQNAAPFNCTITEDAFMPAAPVLRTFVQYLNAFCSWPDTASEVLSGCFVRTIVDDKRVKCRDPRLNRSREI